MCGIAGLVLRTGERPDDGQLDTLRQALLHRGPDGSGIHVDQHVALVHTRLAIIDTANGAQPFVGASGVSLVANGEIYNYIELRQKLAAMGYADVLKTQSDCETVLPLYRHYDLDFVQHLRGMYALALHDPQQDRVVLARDPFGIKPLYYAETSQGLAFASEPQALIKAGWVQPVVRPQPRLELLQMRYTTGRETIFTGIYRVLPGEVIDCVGGRIISRRRHSHLLASPTQSSLPVVQSMTDATTALDRVLEDSVMMHRRSDVPYGVFLSGGSDSAALVALMARQMSTPVVAYTAGFPNSTAPDEREQARAVARAVGAHHVEVEVTAEDFWTCLPQVVAGADDPAADYALIPTYVLAQRARQDVKVVLSGEGGDEMLAGYGRYRSALRPFWLGGRVVRSSGPFDRIPALSLDSKAGWRDGISSAYEAMKHDDWTKLQQVQAVDCQDWLPNSLLMKLDRCLMRHGVEGRTPFLDSEVARIAFHFPDEYKIQKKLGKIVLREWLARELPQSQPFRKKQGFTVPVGMWICQRRQELLPLLQRQPGVQDIVRPDGLKTVFMTESKHAYFAAWTLLFYGLWHQIHVCGVAPEGSALDVLAA